MVEQEDQAGAETDTDGPRPAPPHLHTDSCSGPHSAEF